MNFYQILCVSFLLFGIEGGMWDVIVLISDHCLSIYFGQRRLSFGLDKDYITY